MIATGYKEIQFSVVQLKYLGHYLQRIILHISPMKYYLLVVKLAYNWGKLGYNLVT